MKINYKEFRKWIEALDSGEYKQSIGSLENEYGNCCMGVACRVLIDEPKIKLNEGFIKGHYPSEQPNAPKWLRLINNDFSKKSGVHDGLAGLNDNDRMKFSAIATMLELVYIHKAFK